MRKRFPSSTQDAADAAVDWLHLEPLVEVEITSEAPAWPVESALLPGGGPGWRVAGAGSQTIRLVFTAPQSLDRIRLEFRETNTERTQEYVEAEKSDRKADHARHEPNEESHAKGSEGTSDPSGGGRPLDSGLGHEPLLVVVI